MSWCLCCVISVIALAIGIAALIITKQENFSTIYPMAGDAQKTGWYRTRNRECKPGLNKCVVKNNSGSYHYFCSKNCNLERENVKGTKVQEPMAWQVRYA